MAFPVKLSGATKSSSSTSNDIMYRQSVKKPFSRSSISGCVPRTQRCHGHQLPAVRPSKMFEYQRTRAVSRRTEQVSAQQAQSSTPPDPPSGTLTPLHQVPPQQSIAELEAEQEMLEAQLKAQMEKESAAGAPAGITAGGGISQVRVYEQLLKTRQKMADKLSEAKRYNREMEAQVERFDTQVRVAEMALRSVGAEVQSLQRMIAEANNQLQYGVSQEDAMARYNDIAQRLQAMGNTIQNDISQLSSASTRCVPITWEGVAEEVYLYGSHNGWTHGLCLSCDDYTFGGHQEFHGELHIVPGTYEVKFKIDGVWKLAPDWPTTGDGLEANNLIVVQ